MVRVLVVSDEIAPELTADRVRDLCPELVLSAGDLPWDHVEWVGDAAGAPVVYVPGNHDPETRSRADLGLRWGDDDPVGPRGAIPADRAVVEVRGLRIAGLGGCVRYRNGPHQYSQREYARASRRLVRAARRGGPVDVLLTHAPPLGLGDGDDPAHVGIEALSRVIEQLRPTWHLHGHVHPYGQVQPDRVLGRTTIRNVVPWALIDVEPRGQAATDTTSRVAGGMP
ncbi:MAG: metallophosphoesterase [Marmoricola sp.]|nr:metallophosphoesterase [Marmoricola sp.]